MRSDFDFAPFYRATVGFDRVFDMLDTMAGQASGAGAGYPPYNIEKTGDDSYRIVMAVAGFSEPEPHYHGHRERLRARFREAGAEAVSDYREIVKKFASADTGDTHAIDSPASEPMFDSVEPRVTH